MFPQFDLQALQYASNKSLASVKGQNEVEDEDECVEEDGDSLRVQPVLRKLDKSATTNDISSMIKQRFVIFLFSMGFVGDVTKQLNIIYIEKILFPGTSDSPIPCK